MSQRRRLVVGRLGAGDGTRHALQEVPTAKPAFVERRMAGEQIVAVVGTVHQIWIPGRVRSHGRTCKLCRAGVRLGQRCWRPRTTRTTEANANDRVCFRCWPREAEKGKSDVGGVQALVGRQNPGDDAREPGDSAPGADREPPASQGS